MGACRSADYGSCWVARLARHGCRYENSGRARARCPPDCMALGYREAAVEQCGCGVLDDCGQACRLPKGRSSAWPAIRSSSSRRVPAGCEVAIAASCAAIAITQGGGPGPGQLLRVHQWSRMRSMDRAALASSWLRRSPSGSDAPMCLTLAASARPDTASAQGHEPGWCAGGWVAGRRSGGTSRCVLRLARSDNPWISWEPSSSAHSSTLWPARDSA
jgi:hypothetical protein